MANIVPIKIGGSETELPGRIKQYHDKIAAELFVNALAELSSESFNTALKDEKAESDLATNESEDQKEIVNRFFKTIADRAVKNIEDRIENVRSKPREPESLITEYLNSQLKNYQVELSALSALIPEMHRDCKASVCIPVAAHEESKFIYQTLLNFHRQNISSKSCEVIIFNNHPSMPESEAKQKTQATFKEIERFQINHPGSGILVLYAVFPKADATIGHIRKVLSDVVLYRYQQRGDFSRDHILIRADADTTALNKGYIENFIKLFEKFPQCDAFGGSLSYSATELVRNPLLYIASSFANVLDAYIRRHNLISRPFFGMNVAYRASSYSLIGGYDPAKKVCEDVDLDCRIQQLAKAGEVLKTFVYGKGPSRVFTSARRASFALENLRAPVEQWSIKDLPFSSDNMGVRADSHRKNAVMHTEDPVFQRRLGLILHRTVKAYFKFFEIDLSSPAYRKAFDVCGIDWERTGSLTFKIKSTDRMLQKVKEFKMNGSERYYRKSGIKS